MNNDLHLILKHRLKNAVRIFANEGALSLILALYNYFWMTHIGAFLYWVPRGRILLPSGSGWVLKSLMGKNDWYVPQVRDHYRFKPERIRSLQKIYYDTDVVSVERDDIVFDIGAYIGASSLAAAELGKQVFAIEPSPVALDCLRKNVEQYDNIEVVHRAVYNTSGEINLQHGKSPSDDSIISPDDGGIDRSSSVPSNTVEGIADELSIERLEFLKIEAEGVEPEICEGIGDLEVKKVSAACGEERYGEDVQGEVYDILKRQGFNVFVKSNHPDKMVYAQC